MTRARLRELGITIGNLPSGRLNAITDVAGVWVGHTTLIHDTPRIARTGLTVILPREGAIWQNNCFAGFHALNGTGEMTGIHWLNESGMLCSPIGLTNTHQVGTVHQAFIAYCREHNLCRGSALPVVAETYDGWLNDLDAFHLTPAHVYQAIAAASSGRVAEGNVGGGTGMICHEFKGGIGTASRLVEAGSETYVVGALVQANHGDRHALRLDGRPIGRLIGPDHTLLPWDEASGDSSILVILATDAPLLPGQCRRLAQRATIGMARAGGIGHNGSGDLFLAFATGNHLPADAEAPLDLKMLPHHWLNSFFEAAAEAVEEAIWNCLTAAETMTGFKGRTAHALP
ncbi:MAG: P1 family peptidase, partial [Chloroflexota bacterium]